MSVLHLHFDSLQTIVFQHKDIQTNHHTQICKFSSDFYVHEKRDFSKKIDRGRKYRKHARIKY